MIKVENLKKSFPLSSKLFRKSYFAAVDDVTFEIKEGETFGLVGESGCGKSTLAQILVRLIKPDEGKIYFKNKDITALKTGELFKLRSEMQIIFQHPQSSFNPRMKIYNSMVEPLRIHKLAPDKQREEEIINELLDMVGLKEEHLYRYPRELSGGEIQRLVLARVLSLKPQLIIADEPTSMLDVSVQAQILQLFKELQHKFGISLLFISHDLDVVRSISNRLAVMYEGKIVEHGDTRTIYNCPQHPYSQRLVKAFVGLD